MGARRQVKSWYALKELCAVGVGGDTSTYKNHPCPAGAVTLEACGRGVCVCKLVESVGVCVCVSLWRGCVCVWVCGGWVCVGACGRGVCV